MMERRNNPAGEPCRDWKDTLVDVLLMITLVIFGVAIGIGICKCCPPFWNWLNSGWMKSPRVPKAMFTVGAVCITAARCM